MMMMIGKDENNQNAIKRTERRAKKSRRPAF
jgi:hypothetical protein